MRTNAPYLRAARLETRMLGQAMQFDGIRSLRESVSVMP